MNMRTIRRSFAGGVISPELFMRLDLAKNQTGLETCTNFEVLPHGPVQNRAGLEYINEAKDSTKAVRLLPFSFNAQQTYVLEMGDLYARIHTQGATLLNTAQNISAISKANPGVLTYVGADPTNGTWMYLSGIGGMTQLNGRYVKVAGVNAGANTFQLTDLAGNNIDTTNFGTYTAGGTISPVYETTTPFVEADLFDIHYVQSADVLTLVHPSYAPRELRRQAVNNWPVTSISFGPTIGTPGAPTVTASGAGAETNTYVVTAVATDGLEESLASGATSVTGVTLATAGAFNTIDLNPSSLVSGAVRYNVYKLINGLYGYIGQTDGSDFLDRNITPDTAQTPPIANTPFAGVNDYPAAVSYQDQRRIFGGTNNKPQNLWMTRSATESNLGYSIPTRDNDGIFFRIAAREANAIRHFVPLDNLVMLTSSGEWKVAPVNSDVLTPTSAAPKQFAYEGASNVQPVLTSSALIYAQADGGRVREIRYKWEQNNYVSNDISVLAPDLFDEFSIVDMAYTKAPNKMVWFVRDDGKMLGLTYLPEHDVAAWHLHETDGLFESVAAVREGSETALYAVVNRTIDGRTVRYIERKHTRAFAAQADAFFVDAGLTYSGAAATTISGLWHLEGEEVSILADGAVHPARTVTDGAITLDQAASKVQIGLAYTSDLKTLPLAMESPDMGQGVRKNINKVWLRVVKSSGIFAGPSFDKLKEVRIRTTENYDSPPALRTGLVPLLTTGEWNDEAPVCVRQSDPLPLTITALVMSVALGG